MVGVVFSQAQNCNISGRYLEIENLQSFFEENDDCVIVEKFYIFNFQDKLNAKEEQSCVDKIKGIKSFGIATSSESVSGRRRCFIRLEKTNFKLIFIEALRSMQVEKVIVANTIYSLKDFSNYLNSNL